MGIAELLLVSLGLSADAFSVSVCKGLSMRKISYKGAFITALFFGFFQAVMPLFGYFLGSRFENFIRVYSNIISFVFLAFIGGKMIYEAIMKESEASGETEYKLDIKELIVLSVATSIDAFAVGFLFAAQETDIIISVFIIGIVTFLVCLVGVTVGNRFGNKYEKKAEITGGIVLVLLGIKFLLDNSGIF